MSAPPEDLGRYTPHEQKNRQIVLDYYEALIGRWDFDAAKPYLGDYFIQHNPTIADGLEGLEAFVRNIPPEIAAVLKHRTARVLVDGDLVMLHNVMTMPGAPDTVIVDMFRLEEFKVVEHWDVIQATPSEALHGNGMI